MFAGHLAGELHAEKFFALTNIDGLLEDIDQPDSIIQTLTPDEATNLFGTVIQGGMIPKIEACIIALKKGVNSAHIINGMKEDSLLRTLLTDQSIGTTIQH
jgi:acetylglutamate kinase